MPALAPGDAVMPPVAALQCTQPGIGGLVVYGDYSRIPAVTLLLCAAGEYDILVGDADARRSCSEADSVPDGNKDWIAVRSDDCGFPPLVADHGSPADVIAPNGSLRRFGYWKWFDALCDAAFRGVNREYALGNTGSQRFTGHWSRHAGERGPVGGALRIGG